MSEKVIYSNYIQPICFPNVDTFVEDQNIAGIVAGYGKHLTRPTENIPRHTTLFTKKTSHCMFENIGYLKLVARGSFCAVGDGFSIPCRGDSGGGMYTMTKNNKYSIIGVVSKSIDPDICDTNDAIVLVSVVEHRNWTLNSIIFLFLKL